MESEPWYNVIDRVLPERSKEMTRQQGVVYLKRVIIKPFWENLDWFFALYKDYRVISDVNPSRRGGIKYIPCATIHVYYRRMMVFEYKIVIIHEPEDNNSTIVKAVGKISKEYLENQLEGCCDYKKWYDENNGFIIPYPKLWNGEKLTTGDLLDDFARQYSTAVGCCKSIH